MDPLETTCGKDQGARVRGAIKHLICKACGKPAGIIHDLDMSDCCRAQIERREDHGGKH